MQEYQIGQKIKYSLPDKNNKEHWFDGVIHGVKRYEDGATNMIMRVTYLVDTGRHERLEEYPYDPRQREIDKRVNKLHVEHPDPIKNLKRLNETIEQVIQHKDLPKSEIKADIVRQPEQIELPAERIKPAG